jgi:2'-5' RNA ligase
MSAGDGCRIFVGAFPTGDLAERIQSIRLYYDAKTARITPPHVTLAGTYQRNGTCQIQDEAQTISQLGLLQSKLLPFNLVLGGIHTFPGQNPIIYLGVTVTPELLAVRSALLQILGQDQHTLFSPHLTLAMRLNTADAGTMISYLEKSEWASGSWTARIQQVQLMQRGPGDSAWRCIAPITLTGQARTA